MSQGHRIDLSWKNTSQMFQDNIQHLQLELFKLSNSVLRFKVRNIRDQLGA